MSRIISSQVETHQRKESNVTGTASIPVGYKVHRQASSSEEYQRICGDIPMFVLNQQTKIFNTLKPTGIFMLQDFDKLNKMHPAEGKLEQVDKMIVMKRIQDYVKRGMTAYEEDINTRREKLRAMIQAEETELTRELVNQDHRHSAIRDRELRKDTDEERILEEERKHATVALKRRQQLLEGCPEVRDKITREMTRGVKYSNLAQILEKSSRLREEKQLDILWHEIMLKNSESQRCRDEEERRKRKAIEKDTSRILKEQIAERSYFREEALRKREQERQEHERLWLEAKAEEGRNLAQKQTKREQFKRDLEEQLMLERSHVAERARQESEVAQKLKVKSVAQLAKEKVQIAKSAESLKREMTYYMKSLAELRAEKAKKEAEFDATVELSAKDAQAKQDAAIKKDKVHKKGIFTEFIAARKNQLKMKTEMEDMEKICLKKEQDMNKKNAELDVAACLTEAARRREMALRYGLELQTQLENERMMKCKDMKEHAEKHQYAMVLEKEYQKLTEELLNAPEIITPSAFKIMQKRCVIPRNAKQKALC